jgi:hypothetical protein
VFHFVYQYDVPIPCNILTTSPLSVLQTTECLKTRKGVEGRSSGLIYDTPRETRVRTVGVPTKIQTGHIPDTSQKHYSLGQLAQLDQGHTKETRNCNTTTTSEKHHRFQAGNWFPN